MHPLRKNWQGLNSPPIPKSTDCSYCRWADIYPLNRPDMDRSIGCARPDNHRGQAGEFKTCSCFQREPGTDDDLGELPESGRDR